jgi:predicted MFS family arabinose efflux permease
VKAQQTPSVKASTPPTLIQRLSILKNKKVATTITITFLTALSSLGLYTYISLVVSTMNSAYSLVIYLWLCGVGGVIGSFTVGGIIDKTKNPTMVMGAILTLMVTAILLIPSTIQLPIISCLPFLLWGAMGWASQTPQQHILIHAEPNHAAAAVALNSSTNYLGSSAGAMLGGILLANGVAPIIITYLAGMVGIAALIWQLSVIYGRFNTE